ncbi:FtsQ-type POTRA domain-containing protein [Methylacidiphilum caldifontis]|uniref:Cell division protein n=2 Tax=Methylacidiphilum caldifontis TaxID=2795386 RepID=A0A4Y8PFI3_9BACT|nr:FtsQ-type POTRA domain-containing protein [Methylacidiphilum caldifontis]TFE70815.1 cell division protein [Methylacidiphilum caldifontis]
MKLIKKGKKKKKNRLKKATMEVLDPEALKTDAKRKDKIRILVGSLLFLIILGIVTALGVEGWVYLKSQWLVHYGYVLKKVDIEEIGSGRIAKEEIISASKLHIGDNIFDISLKDVYSKLCSLQEVDKVVIRRQLPDRIFIRVWERKPLVRLALKTKLNKKYCLDEKGYPFLTENREDILSLPEMVGIPLKVVEAKKRIEEPEVTAAINLLHILENSSLHFVFEPQTIDVSRPFSIGLLTRDGVRLTFRINHLNDQVNRLQKIYSFSQSHGRKISMVDLTPDQNVPVIFQ